VAVGGDCGWVLVGYATLCSYIFLNLGFCVWCGPRVKERGNISNLGWSFVEKRDGEPCDNLLSDYTNILKTKILCHILVNALMHVTLLLPYSYLRNSVHATCRSEKNQEIQSPKKWCIIPYQLLWLRLPSLVLYRSFIWPMTTMLFRDDQFPGQTRHKQPTAQLSVNSLGSSRPQNTTECRQECWDMYKRSKAKTLGWLWCWVLVACKKHLASKSIMKRLPVHSSRNCLCTSPI